MKRTGIETVKRVTLTLDEFELRALEGALSYYNMSAENNFDAGYRVANAEDNELKREHKACRQIATEISDLISEMDREWTE